MKQQSVEQVARSWRHQIDIDFCASCGKGPIICVELPYTHPEAGIIHFYKCFECGQRELEDD